MVLAEKAGAVAIESQHLGQGRDTVGPLASVARKGGGRLGDATHIVHVVVAAREQGGAGW